MLPNVLIFIRLSALVCVAVLVAMLLGLLMSIAAIVVINDIIAAKIRLNVTLWNITVPLIVLRFLIPKLALVYIYYFINIF